MPPIKLFNSDIVIADDQSHLLGTCLRSHPISFLDENQYSRYIMSCLVNTSKDGLIFYKFPKNMKVYHGEDYYNHKPSKPKGQLFFNLNAKDASLSGFIHDFIFHTDAELLALDRVSNIKILMAMAVSDGNYEILDALKFNFGLHTESPGKTKIVRQYNQYNEYLILEYLCRLGYKGFAYQPLNDLPASLYLCNGTDYLNSGHYSIYNDQFVVNINRLLKN